MTSLFKNSLISLLTLVVISLFVVRLFLNQSSVVPAWLPPPVCPCWNNDLFQCQPMSQCRQNPANTPSPIPTLSVNQNPQTGLISTILITPDCQVIISFSSGQSQSSPLPTDKAISTKTCSPASRTLINSDKNYAFIENTSISSNFSITIFSLSLNKLVSLENIGQTKILDAIFLPQNHLLVLLPDRLRIYDLQGLENTYPGNFDFTSSRYRSVNQYSYSENLSPGNYSSLAYQGGRIKVLSITNSPLAEFDIENIFPRSSCPCWDASKNSCLPASACF